MTHQKEDIVLLKAKAEQGDADSQFEMGKYYLSQDNEDYQEAYKWMRMAAEQGLSTAQYNLGICYAEGIGVRKNAKRAIYWWEKAAEQGAEEAIAALEEMDELK